MVQRGRSPADFKPFPAVGSGVCEIRIKDRTGAFRVMYIATFRDMVFVLHAFQKKTQKTAPADIALARRRFRSIEAQP